MEPMKFHGLYANRDMYALFWHNNTQLDNKYNSLCMYHLFTCTPTIENSTPCRIVKIVRQQMIYDSNIDEKMRSMWARCMFGVRSNASSNMYVRVYK